MQLHANLNNFLFFRVSNEKKLKNNWMYYLFADGREMETVCNMCLKLLVFVLKTYCCLRVNKARKRRKRIGKGRWTRESQCGGKSKISVYPENNLVCRKLAIPANWTNFWVLRGWRQVVSLADDLLRFVRSLMGLFAWLSAWCNARIDKHANT